MFDWLNDPAFVLGVIVGCALIAGAWWLFLYLAEQKK